MTSPIGKGSKFYSIIKAKCPACHEGEMFNDPNPYHLKTLADMPSHCSVCDQVYEPEPNFYYGAMYVSYAYTVAISVAIYIIVAVFLGLGMWETIIALGVILVGFSPVLFRISRSTWLNIFVHFKPKAQQ